MRWYEYKMEVDDLHASDDLRAKLLALQANAAETPGAKSIAMPAPSPTPKKQKKPLRFPARRWAQLAACAAVCGVCDGHEPPCVGSYACGVREPAEHYLYASA